MAEPSTMALFWAGVIAASILIYVILDGFDLGVGILSGIAPTRSLRDRMIATIAPVWDGNETWLVVIGASLFAAFPAVYAVFLGAFYLPVLLMLAGLIFRGVAFEFRHRSRHRKGLWDRAFCWGSVVVAFVQGAAVGALMRGVPVSDGQFAGGPFDWLHPFPVLTGVGLVAGYALLGAGWLMLKGEGALRDWASERVFWLGLAVLAVLGPAAAAAVGLDLSDGLRQAAARFGVPSLICSGISFYALLGVIATARARWDWLPFALTALAFAAAFAALGTLMWPYMIPYALTVAQAVAPEASLKFLFYAGAVALPVVLVYTVAVYWVFRGKSGDGY